MKKRGIEYICYKQTNLIQIQCSHLDAKTIGIDIDVWSTWNFPSLVLVCYQTILTLSILPLLPYGIDTSKYFSQYFWSDFPYKLHTGIDGQKLRDQPDTSGNALGELLIGACSAGFPCWRSLTIHLSRGPFIFPSLAPLVASYSWFPCFQPASRLLARCMHANRIGSPTAQ